MSEMRKLPAILVADIVGYSRLAFCCELEKREREKKAARLQQRRRIRQPAKVFLSCVPS